MLAGTTEEATKTNVKGILQYWPILMRSCVTMVGFDADVCVCDVGRFRCGGVWCWQVSMWRSVMLAVSDAAMCGDGSFRSGYLKF